MKKTWLYLISSGALILAFTALALAAASGLGHRFEFIDFRQALTFYRWAVTLSLPAAIVGLCAIAFGYFRKADPRLLVLLLVGTLASSAILVAGHTFRSRAAALPVIHDISTDTENPPPFKAILPLREKALNSAEYEGDEIAAQQRQAYPDVLPVDVNLSPAAAFERALEGANRMGWEIVDHNAEEGRIEAVDTTWFFGFKDDVVIRVSPLAEGQSRIDVRSLSRVGKSDVGANAARIRDYSELLRKMN